MYHSAGDAFSLQGIECTWRDLLLFYYYLCNVNHTNLKDSFSFLEFQLMQCVLNHQKEFRGLCPQNPHWETMNATQAPSSIFLLASFAICPAFQFQKVGNYVMSSRKMLMSSDRKTESIQYKNTMFQVLSQYHNSIWQNL